MRWSVVSAVVVFALACGEQDAPHAEVGTDTAGTGESSAGETSTDTDTDTDTGASTDTDTGTDTGGPGDDPIYPVPDWTEGLPEDHGLSSAGLEDFADLAASLDSNCLVVIHEGVLVGEWYWNGYDETTDQDNVFSVTKSFTSALVGIAQAEGLLSIEDSAADYIDEWAGTESDQVTIRNLISNDSGREWGFTTDYLGLTGAQDQTQYAVDLGQDRPANTWWEYNNSAIQSLERVLAVATGGDVEDFAQSRLLGPLGAGINMGRDGAGNPLTYQGMSASCRDLARFGYLYQRGGEWADGEQLVPSEWVADSLVPSTSLNTAYGYMWWLNREGHWVLPSVPLRDEADGRLLPSAPEEVYAAVGALGQVIVVEPLDGYLFVRLGDAADVTDLTGFGKFEQLWDGFAAAKL